MRYAPPSLVARLPFVAEHVGRDAVHAVHRYDQASRAAAARAARAARRGRHAAATVAYAVAVAHADRVLAVLADAPLDRRALRARRDRLARCGRDANARLLWRRHDGVATTGGDNLYGV